MAQHNEKLILKPICKIDITTVNGNMLKGLLLLTYDSVVIIYPGKRQEWNRKKGTGWQCTEEDSDVFNEVYRKK